MTFAPFDNQSQSLVIGQLTLENRLDRVSLYGNIDLTRDQVGLAAARALQAIINDVVRKLEQVEVLPAKLTVLAADTVDNPFK